jgi:hypothetical protein
VQEPLHDRAEACLGLLLLLLLLLLQLLLFLDYLPAAGLHWCVLHARSAPDLFALCHCGLCGANGSLLPLEGAHCSLCVGLGTAGGSIDQLLGYLGFRG